MKKLILLALVATALFVSSCSKDGDEGGSTGSLGVTGSTLYFAFGGEYNAYNLQQSRYIERFGTTDALGKIDISWDNKRILAGYERLSFSDYGGHWLTFSYRSLPSLSKEVLATITILRLHKEGEQDASSLLMKNTLRLTPNR